MNVDVSSSVLSSHACFTALATLEHVENVCSFCSSPNHTTYDCPVLSKGEHVKDTPTEDLSRSSVPHGLHVYDDDSGTHIISVQKFAKGCRFGPFLAPRSYTPVHNTTFSLIIFGAFNFDVDAMYMPELRDLFKVRYTYLDTRNEKQCNWMCHVDPAKYSNEQNLIAYEEDNEVYFAAVHDLDVGDILKVWYSPKYGEFMNQMPLSEAILPISRNILSSDAVSPPELQFFNNFTLNECHPRQSEILLPSIKTIIKPTSYVCYEYRPTALSSAPDILSPTVTETKHNLSTYDEYVHRVDTANHFELDPFANHAQVSDLFAYDVNDEPTDIEAVGDTDTIGDSSATLNGNACVKDDKKIYPCLLCDKKYSTMTNIYRHVRTQHNCFLCSLCMNMFKLESELKEHIGQCPKSDVKKPQCRVCMQYFANSWSLTRHIKIHVSAGECDADILVEKKAKESKKPRPKDHTDTECSQDGSPSLTEFSAMTRKSLHAVYPSIGAETASASPLLIAKTCERVENINNTADPTTSPMQVDKIMACIVCQKKFKSKSCMNKHLRSVHTVRIMNNTKCTPQEISGKASYSKRSHSGDSQSTITHVGSPVNPTTAKALATKLLKKPSIQTACNAIKNATIDSLSPIGIQTAPMPTKQSRPSDDVQPTTQNKQTLEVGKSGKGTQNPIRDDDSPNRRPSKQNLPNGNDITTKSHPSASRTNHCDLCSKTFNKKYELKRHKAVHENISYVCPYCHKVVKRMPSIIKHLRILHPDKRSTWNNSTFIGSLKQPAARNATVAHEQFDHSKDESTITDTDAIEINGTDTSTYAVSADATPSAANFSSENSLQLIDDANFQMLDDTNDLYGLSLFRANELAQEELYDNPNHLFLLHTIQT